MNSQLEPAGFEAVVALWSAGFDRLNPPPKRGLDDVAVVIAAVVGAAGVATCPVVFVAVPPPKMFGDIVVLEVPPPNKLPVPGADPPPNSPPVAVLVPVPVVGVPPNKLPGLARA